MRCNQECRTWVCGSLLAVMSAALWPCLLGAQEPAAAKSAAMAKAAAMDAVKKFPEWDKVVEGTTRMDGLFNLYYSEKEQKLLMEIRQDQYDKEVILPIAIARGAGLMYLGGETLNFGDQWLVCFRRAGDRVLVVRRNVAVRAEEGSPQADALKVSYNDSVILALPVKSERPGGGAVLVDLADLLMTDLADIGIHPDRSRSTWAKVKVFPKNVEIEVSAVFSMPRYSLFHSFFSGGDVPDARGAQVVIHYGMSMLPATGYQPRLADDRVGHFLSTVKDFSQDLNLTPKMRYVTRWNLEKAKPAAEKSPPKQPIIFWIERTVPREYRPYVREGILEWNKAYERVGFIDAIQVRDQQAGDDFDPEDIRYNTFRWITTSAGFAMGPSRTNPKTGEILDADVIFDEGMIRYLREEYLDAVGVPTGLAALMAGQRQGFLKHYAGDLPVFEELASALDRFYLDKPEALRQFRRSFQPTSHHVGPADSEVLGCSQCQMGPGMQRQIALSAAILAARGELEPGGKVPEKLVAQAVKEIVMHEVGHTLGLRHNFKASSAYSLEQVNDPNFTAKHGNSASIMDYLPANIARKGEKQGDYFSPTIGPYDYWAIEYAYKPLPGGADKQELAKIAGRVAEAELVFGTDEDVYMNPDPRINLFDLADPLEYAKARIRLVHASLDDLQNRMVAKGEGWQRARRAFVILLGEMFRSAELATRYVTGEYTCRDHRDDKGARPPMKPIEIAKQREALRLLRDEVLSDKAFHFKPELLRHLAPDHWREYSWLGGGSYQLPVLDYVSSLQRMVVSDLLDAGALRDLQEIALQADPGQKTLEMPEVFQMLTDAVWTELPGPKQGKLTISTIRRNLQREHVTRLVRLVLGPKRSGFSFSAMLSGSYGDLFGRAAPADARALARSHLTEIDGRIKRGLGQQPDAMTKAHLAELHEQIGKALKASVQVNEL
jgi:hypothetical protein